jgi:monofunctional chorismate mutase
MNIELLRKEIDKLDAEIASLLDKRTGVVQEIIKLKKAGGIPVYAPDREKEILANVSKYAEKLDAKDMRQIYEFILEVMKVGIK